MEDCIFCKINNGQIPCLKVYADQNFLAFLDINPCSPGHTIIIPKKHYTFLNEMPDDLIKELFSLINILSTKIQKAMDAKGFNIGLNSGKVAGQEVPHLHVHIIPRYEGDKGGAMQNIVRMEVDKEKLTQYTQKIIAEIGAPQKEEPKNEIPTEEKKEKTQKFYFLDED